MGLTMGKSESKLDTLFHTLNELETKAIKGGNGNDDDTEASQPGDPDDIIRPL